MKKVLGLLGLATLTLGIVWNIGNYGKQTKAGQQEAVMSGDALYANGQALLFTEGTQSGLTTVYSDENSDGILDAGDVKMAALWEAYTSDLAMAVNNIHMILDCDVMLGGYVGSRIGAHIEQVREKAAGRNTFSEDGGYIRACSGGNRTAAMGAALGIIETFLEKI